jgi:hypothetical protein
VERVGAPTIGKEHLDVFIDYIGFRVSQSETQLFDEIGKMSMNNLYNAIFNVKVQSVIKIL